MAQLDLSNPVVLKNFMESQIKEGKGEVITKEKVKVYKLESGLEFVVPGQIVVEEKPKEVVEEKPKNKKK